MGEGTDSLDPSYVGQSGCPVPYVKIVLLRGGGLEGVKRGEGEEEGCEEGERGGEEGCEEEERGGEEGCEEGEGVKRGGVKKGREVKRRGVKRRRGG